MRHIPVKTINDCIDPKLALKVANWIDNNSPILDHLERMDFRNTIFKTFSKLTPEDEFRLESYIFEDKLF